MPSTYDPPKSRPVVVVPYQASWVDEFHQIGTRLRKILQDEAIRIDHIGSTSVPGLAAKDIIDIQITVRNLDNISEFIGRMCAEGYVYREGNQSDIYVGPEGGDKRQWRKRYFRQAEGERSIHIHVRQQGNLNQRYPILFRDYVRNNPTARAGYDQIKRRLVEIFPESIEGYLYIKDPLMDIMFEAATVWAAHTGWELDDQYL
ncbi:MAG: hypothetical protein CME19_14540 [Gemmatimonadetes bacterium]|mgnify:CR=1 FL=1|nr:hypothetical protein [Gemmatimonadota bacterium]